MYNKRISRVFLACNLSPVFDPDLKIIRQPNNLGATNSLNY